MSTDKKNDALELAGAAEFFRLYGTIPIYAGRFIVQTFIVPVPLRSLGCWRRATELKIIETDGSGPIFKIPLERPSGVTIEWATIDQLEDLKQ